MSQSAVKSGNPGRGGSFLVTTRDARGVFTPEDFTPEDLLIGKTAEEFLRTSVMPKLEAIESGDHNVMLQLMRSAGELGLLGADVPELYGGLGLPMTVSALIAEKINPQQSFALTHEAHTVIATLPLMLFGTHDQKKSYLPLLASGEWIGSFALSEANSGSDALALVTRAELTEDGRSYVLNGEKMWITNSAFADLFTVFARVDGAKITGFLVERGYSGVSFGKEEHKLGMHGTSTRRLILDNVVVPAGNALGVGKGHYAAFCALNIGRFKLEAGAVGGLKSILKTSVEYALQRKAFGKRLADFGMIKHKLAEMCARTFSLESMVYRLAADMEAEFAPIVPESEGAIDLYHKAAEEYAVECNIVKILGSEAYSQMADESIQIHGGYGYTEEFSPARTWRDQRLLRIGEGANEIVRLAVVNTLLRRASAGRLALRDAGIQATVRLSRMEIPDIADDEDLGSAMRAAAADLKDLSLFLIYQANERLGADLAEAQEVTAAIADVVCAAYAVESVSMRLRKLEASSPKKLAAGVLMAQVACRYHTEAASKSARYALESMPSIDDVVDWKDEPFTGLANTLTRLQRWEGSPMQQSRDLADAVVDAGGYLLN